MKRFVWLFCALMVLFSCMSCEIEDVTDEEDKTEKKTEKEKETTIVESLSLDKSSLVIYIGESNNQLIATVTTAGDDKYVSWESSNTNVATVNTTGDVYAVALGETTITAKWKDRFATCTVKVNKCSVALNTISQLMSINPYTFAATITPATAKQAITWNSSDTNIVTIDKSGVVTVISPGEVTVTATTTDGATASCEFNVAACKLFSTENTYINGKTPDTDVQFYKFYATGGAIYTVAIKDWITSSSYGPYAVQSAVFADEQQVTELTTINSHTTGELISTFKVTSSQYVYIGVAGSKNSTYAIKVSH